MSRTARDRPAGEPEKRLHVGSLFKNALALMISSGGTAVLGVVFWGVAAHLAPARNIGKASAEVAAMTLLSLISQLSFGAIFERFLPVAGHRTRLFVLRAYAMCVSVALVISIVYLSAGLAHKFIPSSIGWRVLFVVAVVMWTVFVLQDSVLTGLRATRWIPVENISFALAKLALLPSFVMFTAYQGIFLAWTVPVVVAVGAVSWYLFRRRIPDHVAVNASSEDLPSARQIFSLAIAQYATLIVSVLRSNVVVLIVIQRLGAVPEAHYYLPALISNGLGFLLYNVATSFLVEASANPGAIRRHAVVTFRMGIAVLVPSVTIGVIVAPDVLRVFGESYAQHGTTLLRMLLLSQLGSAVTLYFIAFAWIDKRVWWVTVRELVSAAIFFTFMLIFIGHFGILSIGIASLISSALQAVFFLPISIRRFRQTADVDPGE